MALPAEAKASALHLIESGVPIFIAKPAPEFPEGGHGGTGYLIPPGWQTTQPDPAVLDRWREGDALCAVMGHTVDGLDVDTQKGGSLGSLQPPTSYGRARTPSGGTHDLIAPLGARSRDGLLPGVDYKGGLDGVGHGFLFIAPTAKKSKADGAVGQYRWEVEPDLSGLLLDDDTSGWPLREIVDNGRSVGGRPEYDGPSYQDLDDAHRAQADQHLDNELFDWQARLGSATAWDEGQTDEKGRGWEALSRDFAWAIAKMTVCPWTRLTPETAQAQYDRILPEVMATNPKCRGKWYEGILEKAGAQPASQPPWWLESVFEQTPVLRAIRDGAHSGRAIPEGLLGVILGRVLAEVPPDVMLPPVGNLSPASLNLGVALVGRSGAGKSAAIKSSRRLLGDVGLNQKAIEEGIGSGEGMIDVFLEEILEEGKDGSMKRSGRFTTKADPRAIFVVDEVDSMAAVGDRSGSTLNAHMRTALTGGSLKTSNSRAGGRYRSVEEDTYRLVFMVGVQPMASGVLLSQHEESRGTPQRFLWVKMTDKNAVMPAQRPQWPQPLNWEPPLWPDGYIEYPDHVRRDIEEFQDLSVLELIDGNEGHAMLTRLKVAFGLAILHGEIKITDQWWDLSGMLMARSKQVQAECRSALFAAQTEKTYHSILRQKRAEARAAEEVSEDRLGKAASKLHARLARDPGVEFTWSAVKPHSRFLGKGEDRLETSDILEEAAKLGVTHRMEGNSIMVKLVQE